VPKQNYKLRAALSSLWRDIEAHTAKPGERLAVIIALGSLLAGAAAVAAYFLAWLVPSFSVSRPDGPGGLVVADDAVILCYVVAGIVFLPAALWVAGCIPASRRFFLVAAKTVGLSLPWLIAVWLVTGCVGQGLYEIIPGESEWFGIGAVCTGVAATLMLWVLTWRRIAEGKQPFGWWELTKRLFSAKPSDEEDPNDSDT